MTMGARPPIDGATVLLTGASSGIGLELARQLAPRAGGIVLVARRVDRLEALRSELLAARPELKVWVRPCDLVDAAAVDALTGGLADDVGAVDVLINNAGVGDFAFLESADWAKLHRMLELNVRALAQLTYALLPKMIERGRGGVLNVSSGLGLVPMPMLAVYSGTKHFVTGLTEALRAELSGTGVVVSQVCPGPVKTEFLDVAGNPTGHNVPGLVEISARQCARDALRGFGRGRALIVPGRVLPLFLWLGRLTARPILRRVYGLFARFFRARSG